MKKSILESKGCYVCGRIPCHTHHVYFGKNRKASDKNGFTVLLCFDHHEGVNGVHGKNGHELDMALKRECQRVYEKTHSREEFVSIIGRSYIE